MRTHFQKTLLLACLCTTSAHSQNVGIGTSNPTAKFHTVGSARFDTLSGVGIRPVFVDSLGNIFTSTANAPVSTVTNSPGSAIPDFSCAGISNAINLSGLPTSITSSSIRVTINVTHPRRSDLTIYLVAPNGAIINLFKSSLNYANFVNTVFNDFGDTTYSTAGNNMTGLFKPVGDLSPTICITPTIASFSAIGGGSVDPNGSWTLRIFDNISGSTGTLNNWTLYIDPGVGKDGVWGLNGNSGTNGNNFIGTKDGSPLKFKVQNRMAGIIDSAQGNTSLGFLTMDSVVTATDNTVIGANSFRRYKSGYGNTGIGVSVLRNQTAGNSNTALGYGAIGFGNLTGSYNTALGSGAMLNTRTGNYNTSLGSGSMSQNQTGSFNTAVGVDAHYSGGGTSNVAVGVRALYYNFDRSNLVAIGDSSLYYNGTGASSGTEATQNTGVGSKALYSNTIGSNNTATGYHSLQSNVNGAINSAFGAFALSTNTSGSGNTALGWAALNYNTTGLGNTATGVYALLGNTTGFYNTATGHQALYQNTTGSQNTAVGRNALVLNTTGNSNVAVGFHSLYSNTTRSNLVAVGPFALYNNGTGAVNPADATNNTAVGSSALYNNTTGNDNVAVGYQAMYNSSNGYGNTGVGSLSLTSNSTNGNYNTALGYRSLWDNTLGFDNVAVGVQSMELNTNGGYNTAVGMLALRNFTGNINTAIGYGADISSASITNSTALGANALVNTSNTIQLGDPNITKVNTYGNMTVLNGKGLIRSNDGTQQKKITTIVAINTTITAGNTTTIPFSFSESFSSAPDVYVGNVSNPGAGGFAELVLTISGVSASGATLFVFNPRAGSTSPNYSIKIIAIGPQ